MLPIVAFRPKQAVPSAAKCIYVLLLVLTLQLGPVASFLVSRQSTATSHFGSKTVSLYEQKNDEASGKNPLSFLFDPYESKIPKEVQKEIYEAEGNTSAAKDRNKRVAIYTLIAVTGVFMAFFNFFISELRVSETPDGALFSLQESNFGWVDGNFLTQFLFMNKIGGALSLFSGAGAGLMAEAELDARRLNSEKIYEELVRRRGEKERRAASPAAKKKKKRKSTKESKRLGALAEVMDGPVAPPEPEKAASLESTTDSSKQQARGMPVGDDAAENTKKEEGGVFGKMKGFYDRADTMAASQALLLNKKLEDAGVLEKITDETGLRVVGKEAAAKTTKADGVEEPKETKK